MTLDEIREREKRIRESHPLRRAIEDKIYIEHVSFLLSLMERMGSFIQKVAVWDFDINGDCVADAQREANAILKEIGEH